ncbi:NTP transferase domain-containing protein [Lutibacter sp.]|uniref:nucleotidyltransferase family protein n=1 Tax=Lutibacter sp. TaxID=1925666 RepID=UPI0025BB5294|nr:NTP transferase domain-containing protein [Lutibacter sp.]MCF6167905.1 NTP transferase domain-containing protein [Lutibacter sp.]
MVNDTVFILLAGGKSERMGVDKGLLKYQQTFWIIEQLLRISKTTISEVFIGLGYNYQHYFKAIPWFKNALLNPVNFNGLTISVVLNKHPELGSFATLQSVLTGIKASRNILLNPIDIPILNFKELYKIVETCNTIVIPSFKGKNGHPIKINSTFWKQLLTVDLKNEDARLDYQLKKLPAKDISFIKVDDDSIIENLNTRQEWICFLKKNM